MLVWERGRFVPKGVSRDLAMPQEFLAFEGKNSLVTE